MVQMPLAKPAVIIVFGCVRGVHLTWSMVLVGSKSPHPPWSFHVCRPATLALPSEPANGAATRASTNRSLWRKDKDFLGHG